MKAIMSIIFSVYDRPKKWLHEKGLVVRTFELVFPVRTLLPLLARRTGTEDFLLLLGVTEPDDSFLLVLDSTEFELLKLESLILDNESLFLTFPVKESLLCLKSLHLLRDSLLEVFSVMKLEFLPPPGILVEEIELPLLLPDKELISLLFLQD